MRARPLAAALLGALVLGSTAYAQPRVILIQNGVLAGGLPFRFQPLKEPRLDQLGAREPLDAVVAGSAREFEKIVRLRDWVAMQFPTSYPEPAPPWDALTILDWIRSGTTGGFCAQYAQIFVQALAYLGIQARYIEIGSSDNPYAHFLTEVWSNDYNRWVMMDPNYNFHFERGGVPLSALEIHDALLDGTTASLTAVLGSWRWGLPQPDQWPLRTAELYYYLRFDLKADHLTDPENPFDRWGDMVEWQDDRTYPWEVSPIPSAFPKERLTARSTSRVEEAYPPQNQVYVTPGQLLVGNVQEVYLDDNVSGLHTYEVSRGDGTWAPHISWILRIPLAPGDNLYLIRGKNFRGEGGAITILNVVQPAP